MNLLFAVWMTLVTCVVFVDCVRGAVLPPDPADPTTWGSKELPLEVIEAPATASAQIAARARARRREQIDKEIKEHFISTQGMSRAKGRMLAAVETDKKSGKKVAKYVLSDGTVEQVELKVLHTARVKEKQKGKPFDAGHGAAAAAAAVVGAAAALAIKKVKP